MLVPARFPPRPPHRAGHRRPLARRGEFWL